MLGFAFIASMTLTPQPGPSTYTPSLCILCGDAAVQDILLNVILFVPFGLGMRLAGFGRRRAIVIAACTTITVELLQMHIIAGRDSSLGDVITNTLGGALGVSLADSWRLWVLPTARQARRLMWGGAVIWVGVLAASVWGLQRALPPTTMWGQWEPELLHFDRFSGTVLNANAAGFPFPPGAFGSDSTFRHRLVSDSVLVRASVIPGSPTQRVAPILGIYDWQKTQIFLLGQRGRALQFSMRTNAGRSLLRDPVIELDDVFPVAAPVGVERRDTVRVAGGVVAGSLVVQASDVHGVRERRVPLSPGLGWSFFIPWGYAFGAETPFLSMLWLGGLFFPLVYWSSRSGRRDERFAILCGAVVLGLVASPLVLHGTAASWSDWFGVAAGAAVGMGVAALGERAGARWRALRLISSPDGAA